ncbi:hypothetical protein ACOMHN_014008 [Nucella lapillus]
MSVVVAATGRADTGDGVSSDRGNTTALSPTCQHASGQGRADRRGELPCDDTVTQAARLASAEGNHASDDRCPSPRRCPSPQRDVTKDPKDPGCCGMSLDRYNVMPTAVAGMTSCCGRYNVMPTAVAGPAGDWKEGGGTEKTCLALWT